MNLAEITQLLRNRGVILTEGLTDEEIEAVEGKYGFRFPPDLREFLQYVLPVSNNFVDWRNDPEDVIRDGLNWPADGICFDIEFNNFWIAQWGEKPKNLASAFEIACSEIAKAPVLIPIYSHRYIPAEPHLAGNPVLSVYQTDIIYYGPDLAHYFVNEFASFEDFEYEGVREIRFWSKLVS
jgi:hypothetical protein